MPTENQPETSETTKTPETSEVANTEETTKTTEADSQKSESSSDDESLISEGGKKTEEQPLLTVDDLKLPEGVEINEDARSEFIDILNENLSRKELADKLLNLQTTMDQAASDSISKAWDDMVEEWKTTAGAHPDFGGDKLAPALGSIKTLINEVMGDKAGEVFEAFDLTGIGSNPALISLLHKLASERAEGTPASGAPNVPVLTLAQQMFPEQGKR